MSSQLATLEKRRERRTKKPDIRGKTGGLGYLCWTGRLAGRHTDGSQGDRPVSLRSAGLSRRHRQIATAVFEGEGLVRELALAFDACVASIPLVAQATSRLDLVISFGMLAAAVAVAVVVILWVRRRWLGLDGVGGFDGTDGADWQDALVRYRNIRDEGGLSEEEFRRIRTLVGPRIRSDTPELRGRQRPPSDPIGPAGERD